MSLTLGRCIIETDDIEAWRQSGDRVTISGFLVDVTATATKQRRQQLLGYQDNVDEPVIPVTWDEDTTANGWYRVLGADVDLGQTGLVDGTLGWRYQLDLERVDGFAAPHFESVVRGALRVNGHGIATGTSKPWHAVPDESHYYDAGAAVSEVTRTGADGDVLFAHGGSNHLYDAVVRHSIAAGDAYKNAAKLEVWDEDTYSPVYEPSYGASSAVMVGRQIPNRPASWRLSNGLLAVEPVGGTSRLTVAAYDGTQWDDPHEFRLGYGSTLPFQFDAYTTITVLRNSPELVTVRLTTTVGSSTKGSDNAVDLTLRRGDRMVHVTYTTRVGTREWFVGDEAVAAATALTGGIRRTSNDGDGNRWVVALAEAMDTGYLATGRIVQDAATQVGQFAIGIEVGGSAASGQNTAQNLVYQFMAAQSERQVAVSR